MLDRRAASPGDPPPRESLTDLLEYVRAECERRMADLTSGGERGREIPLEWFALNAMERRLRPLVHEAARIEGTSLVYTTVSRSGVTSA